MAPTGGFETQVGSQVKPSNGIPLNGPIGTPLDRRCCQTGPCFGALIFLPDAREFRNWVLANQSMFPGADFSCGCLFRGVGESVRYRILGASLLPPFPGGNAPGASMGPGGRTCHGRGSTAPTAGFETPIGSQVQRSNRIPLDGPIGIPLDDPIGIPLDDPIRIPLDDPTPIPLDHPIRVPLDGPIRIP